ncbi:MAG: putative toxin-antitoxin system toxin component, PIN family [Candidatus Omnitrophota bacterium]|nr:putative toxin-antitoxin system toxin component, PIN family [Candidatus Omnitrophota bacterium]
MRTVLDTNVLVSGLLKPYGAPGQIVRLVASGALRLCHDARVLAEYQEVLRRPKFGFRPSDVDALPDYIRSNGLAVSATPLSHRLRDPDDEMFLEVALAAAARHLITGNLSDYAGYVHRQVQVVSPSRFLTWYRAHAEEAGS